MSKCKIYKLVLKVNIPDFKTNQIHLIYTLNWWNLKARSLFVAKMFWKNQLAKEITNSLIWLLTGSSHLLN